MRLTHFTPLTDEMIAEAQADVGTPVRIEQWNNEATLDTIRHYVWGLGDNNPLWRVDDYARQTRFGGIVAPPTFLNTVHTGAMGRGMAGLQPIFGGSKWEFYEWIKRGDAIRAEAKVGPVKVLEGEHAKRFVQQTLLTDYVRVSDGKVIARSEGRTFRIPRSEADGGLSYEPRGQSEYSPEELERIRLHAISEPVRGAQTRYWDEVKVGEELPMLVKGPINQMSMTSYYAGCVGTPATKSCEMEWLYRTYGAERPDLLPNNYDPSFYAEYVTPSLGHQIPGVAHQIGMPGAYNNGAQRTGWYGHLVTNWMGDDGDMSELESRLTRPELYGDVIWVKGTVAELPEPGLVRIRLEAENQFGEKTSSGKAAVRLPLRQS